ncbi:MAG: DUF6273 domain-containing protein [Prevotellaceae bacterium]|nr:DUF6273 domain-containing protein [Prevotellaceae bacterium]
MAQTYDLPTNTTQQRIAVALEGIYEEIKTRNELIDWQHVEKEVLAGNGPAMYPAGTVFKIPFGPELEYTLQMKVAHHTTIDGKPTMFMHINVINNYLLNGMQFDAREFLYYCESALPAGTYYFTLPDWDNTYGGNKSYHFTTTQQIPAGGGFQLNWEWNTQVTACKVTTFASRSATAPIETLSVVEGASGNNLGKADGTSTNMNHIHRARYGSNNWKESGVRQCFNSEGAAGTWWKPMTKFDRPPSYAATTPGMLSMLPKEFLSVVKHTRLKTHTNNVYEVADTKNSYYETLDQFFLPSRFNVYGSRDGVDLGEEQWDIYKDVTNVERILYNESGSARYVFLRSPNTGYGIDVWHTTPDGSLYSHYAYDGHAEGLACRI